MRRCTLLLLFASLLLFSCRSTNSFTSRKYLPGIFREQSSHENTVAQKHTSTLNSIPEVQPGKAASDSTTEKNILKSIGNCETETLTAIPSDVTSIQPQDTIPKTKREIRRERRKSDQFRSKASFTLGMQSLICAVVFTLMGLWLGSGGANNLTNDIVLLILLLLLIIPLYLGLGVGSLIYAIFSLFFAGKVRSKHKGEIDYEGEKATRMGIILSVIGLIALTIGAILTLPHFLDW